LTLPARLAQSEGTSLPQGDRQAQIATITRV
jgi:hypothetical protein